MKKQITPAELNLSPFTKWSTEWALITAADGKKVNTMTAAWGGLGVVWSKNVVTVYVHPDHYTHEFLEKTDKFSVTFFKDQKAALNLLGTVSGRDRDKIKESGLTVEWADGTPVFKEAVLTITCEMIYKEELRRENFLSKEIADRCWNPASPSLHSMYIGEVKGIYIEE